MAVGPGEDPEIVDDPYARMLDAMMESIPWNERADMATNPFRYCHAALNAAARTLPSKETS